LKPEEPTNPAPPEDRPRGTPQKDSKPFGLDIGSMIGDLNLQISLSEEDKNAVKSALSDMADKMEHRWIVTQRIMVIAIGLAAVAQITNWALML
jgi:hypothetical protein